MELFYVQWRFRIEDGSPDIGHKFFSNLQDATALFNRIKEDPPCQDTINMKLLQVVVPANQKRLIPFLNNLVEFYPEPGNLQFRGLKFFDEDYEELDEHLGFEFNRNHSW